jgi:hypothetical protein
VFTAYGTDVEEMRGMREYVKSVLRNKLPVLMLWSGPHGPNVELPPVPVLAKRVAPTTNGLATAGPLGPNGTVAVESGRKSSSAATSQAQSRPLRRAQPGTRTGLAALGSGPLFACLEFPLWENLWGHCFKTLAL